MKKELLYIYIKNHLSVFYLPILITAFVLWLKFLLHGYPTLLESACGAFILSLAGFFYFQQNILYKKIIAKNFIFQPKVMVRIIGQKICYMAPWLLVLFWPLKTDYMFDHIIGFVFVLFTIGAYVALSAPCWILFLGDVLLQISAIFIVLFLNRYSIEVPYIAIGFGLFTLYSLVIGRKLYRSSMQLIDTNMKLAEAAAEAKNANMAKSDFISMISHEIRTPLHGIMSTVEHLLETKVDNKQKESLQIVNRCSETLLGMLNDVLDLSKIEAKKIQIENINFQLLDLMQDIIGIVKYSAEDKGLILTLDIDPNVPKNICSDHVKIQQIILNLLTNAIKFTDKGSINIKIEFQEPLQKIKISVIDTGIGISVENQQKLFDRFVQADNSVARQYGGTGLGLSIAKGLAQLLGGDIHIDSQLGKGSCFSLEIPYFSRIPEQIIKDIGCGNNFQKDRISVLVAEDNAINQKTVKRILLDQGYDVVTVDNGEAVLREIENKIFDLILMDMNMPIMDGIITTQKLKKQNNIVPIIGLTAATEEKIITKFYEAGIVDHITKPFKKQDLLSKIIEVTQHQAVKDQAEEKENSHIDEKLLEIREDFGDAFYISFVNDSVAEINRLFSEIKSAFKAHDMNILYQNAHDLCAVSGNLGMENTYKQSKILENSALVVDHSSLANLLELVQSCMNAELNYIKTKIII